MKRHRRKKIRKLIKAVLLQLLLVAVILVCSKYLYDQILAEKAATEHPRHSSASVTPSLETNALGDQDFVTATNTSITPSLETNATGKEETSGINLDKDQLVSNNAILVRLSDQKVIYEKSSDEIVYPASLTKIMTAIVAIENLPDLGQLIVLPSEMFENLYEEDASMAGFLPDETASALDLLYGALLPSGAECCIGLSDYIAGSEAAFTDLMNQKAEELKMSHTHFTNTTGLNDDDHYTTVSDLSILLEYALHNDIFREVFTSSSYSTPPTSLHPDGITFYSTLFKNLDSPDFVGGTILGGKTGYTSEAGLCLASLAEKNGTEYILITADAKGNHDTKQYNIEDALFVYDSLSN